MEIYLVKDKIRSTIYRPMSTSHASQDTSLRKLKHVDTNEYFYSPELFDDTTQRKINCYRKVRSKRIGMPNNVVPEKRMKRGDIRSMIRDNLTAVAWRDKCDIIYFKYAPCNG